MALLDLVSRTPEPAGTSPRVGGRLRVTDPSTGAEYVIRVEEVAGRVVRGAVTSPRRARGQLVTTRL